VYVVMIHQAIRSHSGSLRSGFLDRILVSTNRELVPGRLVAFFFEKSNQKAGFDGIATRLLGMLEI
jgi:hypothetical protein